MSSACLTKRERAELWRGAEGHRSSYYWVFEESSDVWDKFEGELQDDIRQHGFRFEWVLLVGSDHMPPDGWDGYSRFITTDAGRAAHFVGDDGALTTLHGFTAWASAKIDQHTLLTSAAMKTQRLQNATKRMWPSILQSPYGEEMCSPAALEARLFTEMLSKQTSVRECFATDDPSTWIRFVLRSSKESPLVSSTEIRRILHYTRRYQIYEALETLVLNLDYFISLLTRNDWWRINGIVEESVGFDDDSGYCQTAPDQDLDDIMNDAEDFAGSKTCVPRVTIMTTMTSPCPQACADHPECTHTEIFIDHDRPVSNGQYEVPSYSSSGATRSKKRFTRFILFTGCDNATKEINAVVARWHTQTNHWRVRMMVTLLLLAASKRESDNNTHVQRPEVKDMLAIGSIPSTE